MQDTYVDDVFFTIIVLLTSLILAFILKTIVESFFYQVRHRLKTKKTIFTAKTKTVSSLLTHTIRTIVFVIALLIILSRWGVNIGPILAGAGVLGLAISFGAQTLIKDIIAGIFIILEDQYNVGDRVKILDKEGTVEQVTPRLTILRDKSGNIVYIPNSQITSVIRYKRN